ncbi:MAG: hypothetical protein ACPGD5_06520 [Salibacteraceae bacterium]
MRRSIVIWLLLICLFGGKNVQGQNNDLVITFSEIDSLQYAKYKSNYSNSILLDSNKQTVQGSSFSLLIADEMKSFGCQLDPVDCYYYLGKIPELNSYVLTNCGSLVCETFLINQTTGEKFGLFSPYDGESKAPLLSENMNSMLVIASGAFDRESCISLYSKAPYDNKFHYNSFESFTTSKWRIYEAVWVNDTSIAIMTFDKNGGRKGNTPLNVKYKLGELKLNINKNIEH